MRLLFFFWLLCVLVSGTAAVSGEPREALLSQRSWDALDVFQGTVSRSYFEQAMDRIYAPTADWRRWMDVEEDGVWIETGETPGEQRLFMRFRGNEEEKVNPDALPPRKLEGLRIVLDPGHIGGVWGPVEERSFAIGEGPVVQEGDLTLAIAKRLAPRLQALGATVFLTRETAEPVTELRTEDFLEEATARLGEGDERVRGLAERLFYRTAEIRARSRRILSWGEADLALALHINASGLADPERPSLHQRNDAHVLINGCYLESELASPDQRLELLWRLFNGYHREEERVGAAMVASIRQATALPAYRYESGNAYALDEDQYLWSRNLLANRIFDCPVVYLEPWQANSEAVYEWAAAGDYDGEQEFGGEMRQSLPAVYCDFVMAGLARSYFAQE